MYICFLQALPVKRILHTVLLLAVLAAAAACSRIPEAYTLLPDGAEAYAKLRVDALERRSGDGTLGKWVRTAGLESRGEVLLALGGNGVTAVVPVADPGRFGAAIDGFASFYGFPKPALRWEGRFAVLESASPDGTPLADSPALRDFIASDEDLVLWSPADGGVVEVRFETGFGRFWMRGEKEGSPDDLDGLLEKTGRFAWRLDFHRPEVVSKLAAATGPVYTAADWQALDRADVAVSLLRREYAGRVFLDDEAAGSLAALLAPVEGKLMLLKLINNKKI